MNAFLLLEGREWVREKLPSPGQEEIVRDLELEWIFAAMAQRDPSIRDVVEAVMLESLGDPADIRYRQEIFADCVAHRAVIERVSVIAEDALAGERKIYRSSLRRPSSTLARAVEVLEGFLDSLRELRVLAGTERRTFSSGGLSSFFERIVADLDEGYLRALEEHMDQLRFREGVVMSAALGPFAKGARYAVRMPERVKKSRRAVRAEARAWNSFEIAPRDDIGSQILMELKDRAISDVTEVLANACDHIREFFELLHRDLAFYRGCMNLWDELRGTGQPTCKPVALPVGGNTLLCEDVRDVALALRAAGKVVGNDVHAEGKSLIVVTGANSGGKSTFLRSIGQAQVMLQCGMFVCAKAFSSGTSCGLFSHFVREEDRKMVSGRLDEELKRMSSMIDEMSAGGMLLMNESFASTTEREGSEIATNVIRGLVDSNVRVVVVTHLYEFAERLCAERPEWATFLRADRGDGGERSFKITEGPPLPSSFGLDILSRYGGWHDDLGRDAHRRGPGPAGTG